ARRTSVAISALVMVMACASGALSGLASGASPPVTVTVTVPSSTTLTNSCPQAPAWSLGTALPRARATTATRAGAWRVDFPSSNDTAQLRLGQLDAAGTAMGTASGTWTVQQASSDSYAAAARGSSATRAWVCGHQGDIRRTDDGGATWPVVSSAE